METSRATEPGPLSTLPLFISLFLPSSPAFRSTPPHNYLLRSLLSLGFLLILTRFVDYLLLVLKPIDPSP